MKKLIILLFSTVFVVAAIEAQTANIAETAPKGILVFLGSKIPNGVKVQSVKVERKAGSTDWKLLTEVKTVSGEAEFFAKVNDNKKYFPDTKLPADDKLQGVWKTAVRTGSLDSVAFYGRIPAVRIALGLCYYDMDVKEKTNYTYRVTVNSNGSNDSYTSNVATFPLHPKFDDIYLNDYDFSDKGLYIRWRSVGKNAPSDFKVFKYEGKTPVEVVGSNGEYRIRDTTFYSLQDKGAVAGTKYQYSVVGIDKYGNTAYGSAPTIITAANFNSVYFKKADALRDKKRLAVKLIWKLSDVANIQSVHVFKSTDALKDFKETGTAKASDTTFTDAAIVPDKMYYYYLLARDRTGKEIIRSATFFESGMDTRKPLTPQILSTVALKNGVKLICSVPDKFIKGIKVYRANGGDDKFDVIQDFYATNDSNKVTYVDSSKNLSGKQTYLYYIVSVNNSSVESEKSNTMQERPDIPTEMRAPAFLRAYYQDGVINLAWQDAKLADATVRGYIVQRTERGSNGWTNIFGVDSIFPGSHYEQSKFEEGKTYDYKVQTVDFFGNKSKGAVTNSVTIPALKVVVPGGLRGVNLAEGVELEWSVSDTSVTGYKVYRYQRGQKPVSIATTNAKTRNYLDKSAAKGELYFYYLTAVDSKQRESEPSEEVGIRK